MVLAPIALARRRAVGYIPPVRAAIDKIEKPSAWAEGEPKLVFVVEDQPRRTLL